MGHSGIDEPVRHAVIFAKKTPFFSASGFGSVLTQSAAVA